MCVCVCVCRSVSAQILGARSPRRLNFVLGRLIICGSSVWNLLLLTLMVPIILKWLLGFWRICAPYMHKHKVARGYNDIALCNTSYVASNILSYQLMSHKAYFSLRPTPVYNVTKFSFSFICDLIIEFDYMQILT